MAYKHSATKVMNKSPAAPTDDGSNPSGREVAELLEKISQILQAGEPAKGLDLIRRSKIRAPLVVNATAVCLLRLGDPARALEVLRTCVLSTGVYLRTDIPIQLKTNFATSLLLCQQVAGCLSVLDEIHDEHNPVVQQLRSAVRAWKAGLSWKNKIRWWAGIGVNAPVKVDFPPGDL